MLLFKKIFLPSRVSEKKDPRGLCPFCSAARNTIFLREDYVGHCRCKWLWNMIYKSDLLPIVKRPALRSGTCSPSWPRWHSRGWSCWASCCPSPSLPPDLPSRETLCSPCLLSRSCIHPWTRCHSRSTPPPSRSWTHFGTPLRTFTRWRNIPSPFHWAGPSCNPRRICCCCSSRPLPILFSFFPHPHVLVPVE